MEHPAREALSPETPEIIDDVAASVTPPLFSDPWPNLPPLTPRRARRNAVVSDSLDDEFAFDDSFDYNAAIEAFLEQHGGGDQDADPPIVIEEDDTAPPAPAPPAPSPAPATSASSGSPARHWCATLNISQWYDEIPVTWYQQCSYFIAGKETAPSTGQKHYQIYLCLKKKARLPQVRAMFAPHNPHFEVMRSNPVMASNYCKKDGDFFEAGNLPVGDAKNKWQGVYQAAQEGRLEDIDDSIKVAYYSNLKRIRDDAAPAAATLDEYPGVYIYGPPKLGKSTFARREFGGDQLYIKMLNKWWDGWNANDHENVLIEDITPDSGKYMAHLFKIWLDVMPFRAEVKNSSTMIRPKKIIITSNYPIEQVFENAVDQEAIRRRCIVLRFEHGDTEGKSRCICENRPEAYNPVVDIEFVNCD